MRMVRLIAGALAAVALAAIIAVTMGFDALGPWGQLGLVALMALVVSAFAPGYFYRGESLRRRGRVR
jgi:peptidoglycan/LPS O-acetylase OafA/YrhL